MVYILACLDNFNKRYFSYNIRLCDSYLKMLTIRFVTKFYISNKDNCWVEFYTREITFHSSLYADAVYSGKVVHPACSDVICLTVTASNSKNKYLLHISGTENAYNTLCKLSHSNKLSFHYIHSSLSNLIWKIKHDDLSYTQEEIYYHCHILALPYYIPEKTIVGVHSIKIRLFDRDTKISLLPAYLSTKGFENKKTAIEYSWYVLWTY